ncbi:MAG: metalloregulator ArsR/SmtB family transcription factor [Acidilobaceae archaeon]
MPVEGLIRIFKSLSDPTRLRVLLRIAFLGPASPMEVSRAVGRPVNLVSYHLGFLSRAGILSKKRVGKKVLYSISDEEFKAVLSQLAEYVKRNDLMIGSRLRRVIKRQRGQAR